MCMLVWDRLEQDHSSQDKLSFGSDNLSLGKNEQPLVWSISPVSSWRCPRSLSLTNWNRQRASCRHRFIRRKICLWYKSKRWFLPTDYPQTPWKPVRLSGCLTDDTISLEYFWCHDCEIALNQTQADVNAHLTPPRRWVPLLVPAPSESLGSEDSASPAVAKQRGVAVRANVDE